MQTQPEIQTEIFKAPNAYQKARAFVVSKGFDTSKEKHVDMGEGLEHVFVWEYPHKYEPNKTCRMADLEFVQRKPRPGEELPFLFDFFQVSIKTVRTYTE